MRYYILDIGGWKDSSNKIHYLSLTLTSQPRSIISLIEFTLLIYSETAHIQLLRLLQRTIPSMIWHSGLWAGHDRAGSITIIIPFQYLFLSICF